MTPLEELKSIIYEKLPELKELTFGCWVQKKSKKYFVTYAERDDEYILVSAKSKNAMTVTNRTWLVKDIVILGHPIQLHHVLRVIGGGYAVTSYGQFIKDMNCCGEFSELDAQWDLSKGLSGQSEPTLTFLLNLLT